MSTSPLVEVHKQAGAALRELDGWALPGSYSTPSEEYQAATGAVGLLDRSHVGRLKISGTDALDLLSRLSTNKLEDLTDEGQGMYTVLTSNKGRIIDLLFVLRLEDDLLVLTAPENRRKVADWIDFYTFTEDVAVKDVTEETAMMGILGPGAWRLLEKAIGTDIRPPPLYESMPARVSDIGVNVIRTDFAGLPGYDLTVGADQAREIWSALLDLGKEDGARPVGMDALDAIRVERGVPAYGRELSEEFNPLEANLLDCISFDKGCYVGQEVVVRLSTYDKVQKYLVGLSWEGDLDPPPGASLLLEEKRVGRITSAVRSLGSDKGVGLGYVRKAQARPGTELATEPADDDITVRVERVAFKP